MDVWILIENEYDEFLLFSENYSCEWITKWFSEKLHDKKLPNDNYIEIEIEYKIINEFFHDCLELSLDPLEYIRKHPNLIVPETDSHAVNTRVIYEIENSASKIMGRVSECHVDLTRDTMYTLGCEE